MLKLVIFQVKKGNEWMKSNQQEIDLQQMYYISKKLEDTFKFITYIASRYMLRVPKYKAEFKKQIHKIQNKIHKQKKKDIIKEKRKQKERIERDKQREDRQRERQRRERQRYKEKERLRREKQRTKDNENEGQPEQSEEIEDYKQPSEGEEVIQELLQKPKEKQNKKKEQKKTKKFVLFEESESQSNESKKSGQNTQMIDESKPAENRIQQVGEHPLKWSFLEPSNEICQHEDKYKILKVDEVESDFQCEQNEFKVPEIKPRQPLTPYFLFLRAKRHKIQSSYPNLEKSRTSELLAKVWKNQTLQERQVFEKQYLRAKMIYERKLQQYYSVHPDERPSDTKKNQEPEQKKAKGKRRDSSGEGRSRAKKDEKSGGGRSRSKGKSVKDYSAKSIFDNMNNYKV